MKKFIENIKHIWQIEELRKKIIYTLLLLFVYRMGAHIVLPGITNANELSSASTGGSGLLGLLNTFVGGAFNKASIFALGVMPYISASIAVQLLGFAIPSFQKMQKEESGRKKMTQLTRYLTVVVTLLQAVGYVAYLHNSLHVKTNLSPTLFAVTTAIVLTTGTLFVMWLGERITENGIGNGVSLLIMVGIISRFPSALVAEWLIKSKVSGGFLIYLLEVSFLVLVIMAIIMLVQGTRRVPINYARQIAGSKKTVQVGGARQYIPLKVNAVGVMPIIFAQALLFIPPMLIGFVTTDQSTLVQSLSDYTSFAYNALYATLVLVFTYFYTALTFNPTQMADDLKRSNAFIPGVKPGVDTANYLGAIMDRITLPGALMLALIGILPGVMSGLGITSELSSFFGGTSMLIMVGVIIDTLQQIESYLLMKKYDGLMSGFEIQGRQSSPVEMPQY